MRRTHILIVLLIAIGSAWLTTRVDLGMGPGWAHNVVRNWEQYGFFNLHGKMVVNPGGFQAETNPESYAGHRPASMYPVFLCYHLFSFTGFSFAAYYALLAAIVLLSIWWLLGRTERAFWLATIAVITPGYVRWQTSLDPNLTAALLGFPFSAAVIWLLRRSSLNWQQGAGLLVVIMAYSAVNWTTVLVHAMLFVTLLVLPGVPRRHLFVYAGLTAVAAGAVLLASLASKMTTPDGSSRGLATMLQGYGWGDAGYGVGMSTRTALLRLLVVNLIGLLPLLAYVGWQYFRRAGGPTATGLLFLLPLLMSAVDVLGLRNYFGHHPWMSVSFILLGLILSAVAWTARDSSMAAASVTRLPVRFVSVVLVFVYSLLVQSAGYAHNSRELALVKFIRENTTRDTTVVIRRDSDSVLSGIAGRLPEQFDRHTVVVDDANPGSLAGLPAKRVFLTAVQPPEQIVAQTSGAPAVSPLLGSLLNWYSFHIAKRRAGDKLEVGDNYFLYRTSTTPGA